VRAAPKAGQAQWVPEELPEWTEQQIPAPPAVPQWQPSRSWAGDAASALLARTVAPALVALAAQVGSVAPGLAVLAQPE
jgi:hypothetical protein